MSPLLLVALISLSVGETNLNTVVIPWPVERVTNAEIHKDPTISHLKQNLVTLRETLADAELRTRHPEKSTVIKKLREKIRRTEDAIEDRKAALRPQLWYFGPLPRVEPPAWRLYLL